MKRNMVPGCVLVFAALPSLLIGCGERAPSTDLSAATSSTPTTAVAVSTGTPVSPPTTTRPAPTTTTVPGWVSDLAEPVLAAIAERPPDVVEDFSNSDPLWRENGVVVDGALVIEATPVDGKEGWGSQSIPDCTLFRTFVLAVDVDVSGLPRGSAANIQYSDTERDPEGRMTEMQHYNFELKKNRSWHSIIGPTGVVGGQNGRLRLSVPPVVNVVYISRGTWFAVYLNGAPVTYGEYVAGRYETELALRSWSDGSGVARAVYDNVRIWDLDDIPGLP